MITNIFGYLLKILIHLQFEELNLVNNHNSLVIMGIHEGIVYMHELDITHQVFHKLDAKC